MNVERLQELKKLLSSIPESHFNLGVWLVGFVGEGRLTEELLGECGSSGCAVGWACTHKPFIEQGLSYKESLFGDFYPSYMDHRGMYAVMKFFEIEEHIAETLFHTDQYMHKFKGHDEDGEEIWDIKPTDVAVRIQLLLDNPELSYEDFQKLIDKVELND